MSARGGHSSRIGSSRRSPDLDAHIKVGNSLLGTTPELVEAGIPDAAYEPITGDDRAVARAWRDHNRAERRGQQSLFEAGLRLPMETLAQAARELEGLPDDNLVDVRTKAERFQQMLVSTEHVTAHAAADAWCAAFVAPAVPGALEITTATLRQSVAGPGLAPGATRELIATLATKYGFFHWPLEFPQVFARGGFDIVLGNPPWERVKLQEKEFFAELNPSVAKARNAAERKRLIVELEANDPALWQSFQDALRRSDADAHLLRNSGAYPLTGRGDINTYAVFAELALRAAGERGWVGIVLPSAIATDDTTSPFFRALVERRVLRSLYDFRNSDAMFKDVGHRRFKFCLLTLSSVGSADEADLFFFAVLPSELLDGDRHFTLDADDFALLNPNSRTCPTFRSRRDAEIVKGIYRRVGVLVREGEPDGNPWGMTFLRMFDMANDSGRFLDGPGPESRPLYEAKMLHQFDHRYGDYALRAPGSEDTELPRVPEASLGDPNYTTSPRYWVATNAVNERLVGWESEWLLGWRDITNATNERAMIASVLPRAGAGHTFPLMRPDAPAAISAALLANVDSFVFDYVVRQKLGGTHLTYGVFEQLPVLVPTVYEQAPSWTSEPLGSWIRRYVVELVYTSWSLESFAADVGYEGPPFVWNSERRETARAELDAAFFPSLRPRVRGGCSRP
jgi:hypothetical protein